MATNAKGAMTMDEVKEILKLHNEALDIIKGMIKTLDERLIVLEADNE